MGSVGSGIRARPMPELNRLCHVCGVRLRPFTHFTLTAHEFKCYKAKPDLVPEYHAEQFKSTLAWQARSDRAKAAARKRRKR